MGALPPDPDCTAQRALRLRELRGGGESLTEGAGSQQSSYDDVVARIKTKITSARARSDGILEGFAKQPADTTEAEAFAKAIVNRADKSIDALVAGAPPHQLTTADLYAVEAVIQSHGRPAVRVLGNDLEDFSNYPGAGVWKILVDDYRETIMSKCAGSAAVHVTDLLAGHLKWVQGSAWLMAPDLAVTNRHVLFPPFSGARLARRIPGTQRARLRRDFDVALNFDFQTAPVRDVRYRITDILFVAGDDDPLDAAVLKVEPIVGVAETLKISSVASAKRASLYVIGHPGLDPSISGETRIVFGDPDEKKRVSFGDIRGEVRAGKADLLHDASTIGGYSGAPVLDFATHSVTGLHYWGETAVANRAISCIALQSHPEFKRYIP